MTLTQFTEHRGLLYAVAYRMLGSVADAEDVVQDTWLRWSRVDPATVGDPEAYLVKVATRLSIASILGRRDADVRQLAHRARTAVADRRHRYDTDPETQQQVTVRFLDACWVEI